MKTRHWQWQAYLTFGGIQCTEVKIMMSLVLLLAGLALFIAAALKLRMRSNLYRQEQAISSPLAEAMGQLVGISGGIYLSLVMLVSFLGIEAPQKICFLDMLLDPLALLSILLACLQPLGLAVLRKILSGGGR